MPRIWLLCCYACVLLLQSAPALELHATPVEKLQNVPGIVYDVAQDQQDFLWLAAEYDGLLRFDGTEYLRFSPANAGPPFSYSQVVNDSQNNLWVATWGHGLWHGTLAPLALGHPFDRAVQAVAHARDGGDAVLAGRVQGLAQLAHGRG